MSQAGGDGTGQEGLISTEYLLHVTPDEADEGHHHDKRPRRGLTQGQTVNHVRRGQPAVVADCTLVDIGQHRITVIIV